MTQPSASDVTFSSMTVSGMISTNDRIRCAAVASRAQAPSAKNVFAGIDAAGKESLGSSTEINAFRNQLWSVTISQLKPGTKYDIYCATFDSEVVSKAAFTTTLSFLFQPVLSTMPASDNKTEAIIGVQLPESSLVRCVAVRPGQLPSPEQIRNGQTQGNIVADGISMLTDVYMRQNSDITIKGMSPGQPYLVYCSTSTDYRSQPLTINTVAAGICAALGDCTRCLNSDLDCSYDAATNSCIDQLECRAETCVTNVAECGIPQCDYGTWSEWTPCTEYCASGVHKRTRTVTRGANDPRCLEKQNLEAEEACNVQQCMPPTLGQLRDRNYEAAKLSTDKSIMLSDITSGEGGLQRVMSVLASTDNTNLITNLAVQYQWPATTGTLTFKLRPNVVGAALVTVSVMDEGTSRNQGLTTTVAFMVVVSGAPVSCEIKWTAFSDCSATCAANGKPGTKTRQSEVVTQSKNGGTQCPFPLPFEEVYCNLTPCPVPPPRLANNHKTRTSTLLHRKPFFVTTDQHSYKHYLHRSARRFGERGPSVIGHAGMASSRGPRG
jgi:hypothetical protein